MRSRYGVGCAYLTGWVLGGTSEPNGVAVPRFSILLIVAWGLGEKNLTDYEIFIFDSDWLFNSLFLLGWRKFQ